MAKIFVTRHWPGDSLDELEKDGHDLEIWPEFEAPPHDYLLQMAKECEVLITTVEDVVDAAVIEAGKGTLKIVAQAGVGVDNIDRPAAKNAGIWVTNAPGVLTEASADLAFALLITVARRIVDAHTYVQEGKWSAWHPSLFLGHEMHGATVGVVGLGRIGSAFARRCEGFGMNILYSSRTPKAEAEARGYEFAIVEELLPRCDFVSLHTPLTDETRGLMNADRLSLMKTGAILINTARGPVVNTSALVEALNSGHLGGAGLDVTDPEPLPGGHPLLDCPNTVVVPHIGSANTDTRAKLLGVAVQNTMAVLRGKRPGTVIVEGR